MLRRLVPFFARSGPGHFADKYNRTFSHARQFYPLARELRVGFLKPGARRPARGLLGRFRKFEVPCDSFFAIFVRTHTRTVRRD